MRRKLLLNCTLFGLMLTTASFASEYEATPQEALMLRRISEFWKDGDYVTVKKQIHDYLAKHHDSKLSDHLYAMLGDIYFQEKDFKQALTTYALIKNPEIQKKVLFNSLQARFDSKDYVGVVQQATEFLKMDELGNDEMSIKIRRLVAEALFREAFSTSDDNKKSHLLTLAKPHYEILSQTSYGDRALFPLAEIHRQLKENDKASDLYLLLAKKFPDHKERFLFQAAVLQISFNKEEALANFGKIYEMNGKRAQLAAFNKLVLLYNEEKFADYLLFYEQAIKTIPAEKAPLLQFYQGKSYYAIHDYEKATLVLERFVSNPLNRSKEYKTALLLLINCAKFQNDLVLLEKNMVQLKTSFPSDSEIPKAMMMQAQLCRQKGDLAESLKQLQMILTDFPEYKEKEHVLFDYALILANLGQWSNGCAAFDQFLREYPQSPKCASAKRNLINCYIEILKDTTRPSYLAEKESFVKLLVSSFKDEGLLTEDEKETYLLAMVKCLYELNRYEEAITFLEPYLTSNPEDSSIAERHLLMALCYQKLQNIDLFISHAEKALSMDPQLEEKEILHLELYNSYLALSLSEKDQSEKNQLLDLAAEHLYLSSFWKERGVKLDNQLWLANHYYFKVKDASQIDPSQFERSLELFENLLGVSSENLKFQIGSDSLYLENEVLKFADLIGINQDVKRQISILEALVHQQQNHPELAWKLQKRTLLELANAYKQNHQTENAKKYYQQLINLPADMPSLVVNTAQLHLAHLDYSQMKNEVKNMENGDLIAILHTLKDLQIQKNISSEPLHLEAALFYAEIRSEMDEKKGGAKNRLFFLKRMKENFTASDDNFTQEYQENMDKYPDKARIYHNYMKYVQADMLRAELELAIEANKMQDAHAFKEEALRILNDLLKSPDQLKPYLLERVEKCKLKIISSFEPA